MSSIWSESLLTQWKSPPSCSEWSIPSSQSVSSKINWFVRELGLITINYIRALSCKWDLSCSFWLWLGNEVCPCGTELFQGGEISENWEPRETAENNNSNKNLPYRRKLLFSHSWSLEFHGSLAGIIKVKENFKEVVLWPPTFLHNPIPLHSFISSLF